MERFPMRLIVSIALIMGGVVQAGIRGRVTDKNGNGIAQAIVKLLPGMLIEVTGDDGRFEFAQTGVLRHGMSEAAANARHGYMRMAGGKLILDTRVESNVEIQSYDLRGRISGRVSARVGPGRPFVVPPIGGSGLVVHQVSAGSQSALFSGVSMTNGSLYADSRLRAQNGSSSTRSATKPDGGYVINVIKEGYVDFSVAVGPEESRDLTLRPAESEGTVTDIDGNVYQTVKIGNQVWTAQNFRASRLNDGEPIRHVPDSSEWGDFNLYEHITVDGSYWGSHTPEMQYCWYNNTTNPDTIEQFGALYTWQAVSSGRLAPPGWHVPDSSEWNELFSYLEEHYPASDSLSKENVMAKAIAAGTMWKPSTVSGTMGNDYIINNATGFNAMPSGWRTGSSAILFLNAGEMAYWWSSTEEYPNIIRCSLISNFGSDGRVLGNTVWPTDFGFSVRLVKDRI